MALVGLHLEATREYRSVYDPDRDNENATVFMLGTITSTMHGQIIDQSKHPVLGENGVAVLDRQDINAVAVGLVQFGLKGWRNFRDNDGKEIPFETEPYLFRGKEVQVVASHVLVRMDIDLIAELAGEIQRDARLSRERRKNFVRSPSPSSFSPSDERSAERPASESGTGDAKEEPSSDSPTPS